jgi:hypothetical protein
MIRSGWNEAGACQQLNYDLAQLARKKRVDRTFAAEVKAAKEAADQRLRRVLDQRRTRTALIRLDKQLESRERDRQREYARNQERTARVVEKCAALERAVASGSLSPTDVARATLASLLNGSAVSNGRNGRSRKRA